MPRIYKPVGPASNKAAAGPSANKAASPATVGVKASDDAKKKDANGVK